MGLTHYWRRGTEFPARAFAAAVEDVQTALAKSGVVVAGFEGTGHAVLSPEMIVFNGARPAAAEPMEVHAVEFDRRGRKQFWSSCKTQGLPYDLVVKVTLIILKQHLCGDQRCGE